MKKKLHLPMSMLLAASLTLYFVSETTELAGCTLQVHDTRLTCDNFFRIAGATDTEHADGIVTAKMEASERSGAQRVSIPDRALRLIDSFGKLVMVI